MATKTDNQVKLRDGHSVGYAEYGDPKGKPVLHFHGVPSSRFEGSNPAIEEIATRLHARVIVVERPGIGLSDYKPYTIASWPDIVVEFADNLHLDRFAVMGVSAGGKYVMACAWKIPQRLTAAGVVSGTCPFDLPGAKETLSKKDRQIYGFADKVPWMFRLMLWKVARDARKNPSSILSFFANVSEPDKIVLARPDSKQMFEKMMVEAFHQGTKGPALDFKLQTRPWGFSLQEVKMPVYIWHGETDKMISVEQARIMAKAIPNCRAKFYPDKGHLLINDHYDELLRALVS